MIAKDTIVIRKRSDVVGQCFVRLGRRIRRVSPVRIRKISGYEGRAGRMCSGSRQGLVLASVDLNADGLQIFNDGTPDVPDSKEFVMKLTYHTVTLLGSMLSLPVGLLAAPQAATTPAKPAPAAAAAKKEVPAKPAAPTTKDAAAAKATPTAKPEATPQAQPAPVATAAAPTRKIGKLDWHTDYVAAYDAARTGRKMLFIVFRDDRQKEQANAFERNVLASPAISAWLNTAVRVTLPLNVAQPVAAGKKPARLIDHTSFQYMYGQAGVAVIDLTDKKSPHYGNVVSAHPVGEGELSTDGVRVVLGLPKATVTQRALTFAVLMNAAPASTTGGQCHGVLCEAARQGSELMAQYGSVGHHQWGERSNNISAQTGRGASEVAAMGFGTLQAAAVQCVSAWQGSPTHWGIMSSPATLYGYDLVQAGNGSWYGTGVFAN